VDALVGFWRKGNEIMNWDKINEGSVSLEDYKRLDAKDSNAFWRLDHGHIQNVLEEAIEKIEVLEKSNASGEGRP